MFLCVVLIRNHCNSPFSCWSYFTTSRVLWNFVSWCKLGCCCVIYIKITRFEWQMRTIQSSFIEVHSEQYYFICVWLVPQPSINLLLLFYKIVDLKLTDKNYISLSAYRGTGHISTLCTETWFLWNPRLWVFKKTV